MQGYYIREVREWCNQAMLYAELKYRCFNASQISHDLVGRLGLEPTSVKTCKVIRLKSSLPNRRDLSAVSFLESDKSDTGMGYQCVTFMLFCAIIRVSKEFSMKTKTADKISKNLVALKDMAMDVAIKSVDLLDPAVWANPEIALTQILNLGRTFTKDRLQIIFDEIRQKRKDKEIDERVLTSEKTTHSILDLAKFLAHGNPDVEVWDAAKKIFIQTLQKDVNDKDRTSFYELISICKELKGTEIRILAAAYKIFKTDKGVGPTGNNHNVNVWATDISNEIGLETPEEVLRYEENLMKQKLIVPREMLRGDIHETWIGASSTFGHRLTLLGRKLAESLNK